MDNRLNTQFKCISQEGLKLLACLSMLLDHIGAIVLYPIYQSAVSAGSDAAGLWEVYRLLRTIGRLAFPIYCFLLSEGVRYTRNPQKYGLRLLIGALLSELPFDLALHGGFSWQNQSVMITLLLGFLALEGMKRSPRLILKILIALPFCLLAELLHTDYGAEGVALVVLFSLTREVGHGRMLQFFGMWFLFSPSHLMMLNWLGGFQVTTQELAVFALIPISLYSQEKRSGSKGQQWAFYLFYPIHLTLLWLLKGVLHG